MSDMDCSPSDTRRESALDVARRLGHELPTEAEQKARLDREYPPADMDCSLGDARTIGWVDVADFVGPPKPWRCVDGYQSHEWLLGLDEGRPSLRTDCELCCSGMADWLADDDYLLQMDSMPVRLSIEHEPGNPPYGIDPYVWIDLTPSRTDNVDSPCDPEATR